MNVKLSTMAAGIATVVIVAAVGIIAIIGEQQMASAVPSLPRHIENLLVPIKCPPGEILIGFDNQFRPICISLLPD